jgi:hypothetical protein
MMVKFRNLIRHDPEYRIKGTLVMSGKLAGYFRLSNTP